MRPLVTLEHSDPDADVLMLSNNWPHPGEPRYGIFAKRQVDSLVSAGLRCDVLFVRGFESPLAYAVAALKLLRLSIARRPKYRLVHAHSGALKAGVAFYGTVVDPPAQSAIWPKSPLQGAGDLKAPVLGLYGEADQGIPLTQVEELKAALTKLRSPFSFKAHFAPQGFRPA